jgi:Txe/YoeB family toxin of Txe-Axe toxin-antitoxin module
MSKQMNTYEDFRLSNWFTQTQPSTCPKRTISYKFDTTNDYSFSVIYDSMQPKPKPKLVKLVNNNPYTIAFWSDNTQTRATCLPEDIYSPQKGLFICRMKKKYGSWTAYQEAKKNKQADKEVRKLLRKIARKIELENALVINVNK